VTSRLQVSGKRTDLVGATVVTMKAALSLLLICAAPALATTFYTVTDLGSLGSSTVGAAINASGRITGYFTVTVQAQDANGNLAIGSTFPVTISSIPVGVGGPLLVNGDIPITGKWLKN
jgi:hypothetical protein